MISKNELKILIVTPLPPIFLGGIEEYVYHVSSDLEKMGCDVRIVTSSVSSPNELVIREKPYEHAARIEYLDSIFIFRRPLVVDPVGIARLARLISESDVVHIFTPFPAVEAITGTLARIYHRPLVTSYICDAVLTSDSSKDRMGSLMEAGYDSLSAIPSLHFANCICSSSQSFVSQSRVLVKYADRVTVVHQGIALDELATFTSSDVVSLKKELSGNSDRKIISFVGRLVTYKGVTFLIQAFDLLVREKKDEDSILVIGGTGPEKSNLEEEVKSKGLTRRVKFLGYVLDKDLPVLLAASDVFVVPSISTNESIAISLLQAMSLGVPVIGTSIGGTEEAVPNDGINGLIVQPKDPAQLKDAIANMLSLKHSVSQEKRCARSWSDVAADYLEIYKRILN